MMDYLIRREAPHMGDNGKNDPKHGSPQVFRILAFCHFRSHVGFASSNSHFFGGVYSGIALLYF